MNGHVSAKAGAQLETAATRRSHQATPLQRGQVVGPTFQVAGFWHRVGAALLDVLIVVPVAAILALVVSAVSGIRLPAARHHGIDFWLDLLLSSDPALVGFVVLTVAIGLVYAFVFQLTLGRTVGMRVLKIRIIDLYGDEPSTRRALLRTLGYLAGLATLGLGFLWVGFDAERRGLHDWLSGTYVVKV